MTVHAAPGKHSEWYTPARYIESARNAMGSIEFDPYSCDKANETVKADIYGTRNEPIPTRQWRANTMFVNPMYSDFPGQANSILFDVLMAWKEGRVISSIVLVNQSMLYQSAAQSIMRAGSICLCNHRIKFFDGTTNKIQDRPPQANAFLFLPDQTRPDETALAFTRNFNQYGAVMHR